MFLWSKKKISQFFFHYIKNILIQYFGFVSLDQGLLLCYHLKLIFYSNLLNIHVTEVFKKEDLVKWSY